MTLKKQVVNHKFRESTDVILRDKIAIGITDTNT